MTSDDVHPFEMHDPLYDFLADLRRTAAETPAPAPGEALTTLFRDGAAPVVVPPARRGGSLTRVRLAVAGAVAATTFGGLGVAGALPGPVQGTVADVVDVVGVHLPDGEPDPTTTTSTTHVISPPPTSVPPVHRTTDGPAPAAVTPSPATGADDEHGDEPTGERDEQDRDEDRDEVHGREVDAPSTTVVHGPTTTREDRSDDEDEERAQREDRTDEGLPADARNPSVPDDVHP